MGGWAPFSECLCVVEHYGSAILGERKLTNGRKKGFERERKLDLSVEVEIKRGRRG